MFAKKITTKWIKKADAIVTGLILWWILASVYGIKKYNEAKKPDEKIKKESFLKRFFKKLLWKK